MFFHICKSLMNEFRGTVSRLRKNRVDTLHVYLFDRPHLISRQKSEHNWNVIQIYIGLVVDDADLADLTSIYSNIAFEFQEMINMSNLNDKDVVTIWYWITQSRHYKNDMVCCTFRHFDYFGLRYAFRRKTGEKWHQRKMGVCCPCLNCLFYILFVSRQLYGDFRKFRLVQRYRFSL